MSNVVTYQAFERKIIYAFSVPNKDGRLAYYDGLEKIGDASISDFKIDARDNSDDLKEVARKRIKQYAGTSGLPYQIDISRLAVTKTNKIFRDHDVHEVLRRSGIPKEDLGDANEWYRTDVKTIIKAIEAVEEGKSSIYAKTTEDKTQNIQFRPEQDKAIKETIDTFKKKDKMLWNAKMRFGKTLSALQIAKKNQYKKTLIITHRPVVSDGWFEDFHKIFTLEDGYVFGSKIKGEKIKYLANQEKPFVYFASMQDLRGSEQVGGKHGDKNNEIFAIKWDFVIIDEAHEGTRTELAQNVLDSVKSTKEHTTKILELSGTPFNILDDYGEEQVFTWDYVMEQEAKQQWSIERPDEPNPYQSLPKVNMYTFELQKKFSEANFISTEDKAFNFMEFFRVNNEGEFIYEEKVNVFLDEISKSNSKTNYPFSTEDFRNQLRHTLWLLPSVASCKAMKELLEQHPIFKTNYTVINVVDDGHEDGASKTDLERVRKAITTDPAETKTITLTVRKLTTGVNVPEWAGVVFLNNTTSPANYLQAAFRAQTPFSDKKMGEKTNCYIFDFAPDRALTIMTEAAKLNSGVGKKNTTAQKEQMAKFINFLPIIGETGNGMQVYNVDSLLTKLKRVYAEKAVRTGFEDDSLYNDQLLTLTDTDVNAFNNLKAIIGKTDKEKLPNKIDINNQGLSDEEYEQAEKAKAKPKKERSPEEQDAIDKLSEAKKNRKTMISILRGISVRIPLMIYGMDLDIDKDIKIKNFANQIDDTSWKEFMPKGVTKELFNQFSKYYDGDVFIEAGKIIRNRAKSYDELDYIKRAEKIAELFATFKNPDKETVLTPWRVVNLQLAKTIGGLNYYDNEFSYMRDEGKELRHWVEMENTGEIFSKGSKILDMETKTGLYSLYAAASLFYQRCNKWKDEHQGEYNFKRRSWEIPQQLNEEKLIGDILQNNIYFLANTPMAKTIARRTLAGYKDWQLNMLYIEDLSKKLKFSINETAKEITEGFGQMKFDVIIGNPPYQEENTARNRDDAIYPYFMEEAYKLADIVSFITPARFLSNVGSTSSSWNEKMLSDEHLKIAYYTQNSADVFPNTDIKSGVVVTYYDKNQNFGAIGTFISFVELNSILHKVNPSCEFGNIMYVQNKFNLDELYKDFPLFKDRLGSNGKERRLVSSIFDTLPEVFFDEKQSEGQIQIYGRQNNERVFKWVDGKYIEKHKNIDKYKVFVPAANGSGAIGEVLSTPLIGEPLIGHTQTFISLGSFDTKNEATALYKYLKTKFARAMLGIKKTTQNNKTAETWSKVPIQDFTANSDIEWSKSIPEIDKQLYKKYGLDVKEIAFIEEKVRAME